MSTEVERENEKGRDERGQERIPFDAMVEMGGALGPTFEAQAIDVSRDGMHLKTAYLPDVGQPLTCRFEAGTAGSVLASGEVVWKQDEKKGGEFGVRFTQLDNGSVRTLEKIVGLNGRVERGADGGPRVRLHIDGLASPMRARVRGTSHDEVTVGSELGFLQVGKELELEDAESGGKRPARIDRVEVEIDPESRIPRLVVALRYEDVSEPVDTAGLEGAEQGDETDPSDATPDEAVHAADGEDGLDGEADEMDDDMEGGVKAAPAPVASAKAALEPEPKLKSAFARGAAGVAPAFAALTKRARTAFALLAAKRAAASAKEPARRTTAPAPGGGLHSSGKKVVRGETPPEVPGLRRIKIDKRHAALGGAAALAIAAVAFAMHKPSAPPPEAAPAVAAAPAPVAPAPVDPALANAGLQQPLVPAAPVAPPPPMVAPIPDEPPAAPAAAHKKTATAKVTPFGNGNVNHGNVLRLKMDGPIEKIQGALQPTGFLVTVPGRKSLEPAAPLAARDGRIASIKVANDGNGAELDVAFRDGVPQFQVRAKGDTLELVLAAPGKVEDHATASKPPTPVAKKEPRKTTHHKR
jgi:hypothetical protein